MPRETTKKKASTTRKSAAKTRTTRSGRSRTTTKRVSTTRTRAMRTTATRGAPPRGRGTRAAGGRSKGEIRATNLQGDDRKYLEAHGGQLSPSTLRAKWIHDPAEHQDRPGQTLATRSGEVIKHWAEERGAVPSTVPGTEHDGHLGVLRFNFPGYGGASLQEVSWEDWLGTFSSRDLVFVFQENKKDGAQSNFFKLDNPNREEG